MYMAKVIGKHDFKLKMTLYNALGSIFTRYKDISTHSKPQPTNVKTITSCKVISPLKRFNQLQTTNSLTND